MTAVSAFFVADKALKRPSPPSVPLRLLRHRLARAFATCACFLTLVGGIASPAHADILSEPDKAIYLTAFALAKGEQWPAAIEAANHAENPVLRDVLLWEFMKQPNSGYSFGSITGFVATHPHWPSLSTLRRRAVDAINGESADTLVKWFDAHPPFSGEGKWRYAQALEASGQHQKAVAMARDAWTSEIFNSDDEASFLKQFGANFTRQDHLKRMEWLLWENHHVSMRRMMSLLPADYQALAEARIALQERKGAANRMLRLVPQHLMGNAGLIYDRIRWRMKKDLDDSAGDLLKTAPPDPEYAEEWWGVRHPLARYFLRKGHITTAYQFASRHGLTEGSAFVEAEWLSGWIALRFLNDAKTALKHFENLNGQVFTPISLARAAYWQGRAAEVLGQKAKAQAAYQVAAVQITTFYGQLAAEKVAKGQRTPLPATPTVTDEDRRAFAANDLVQAVRALAELGNEDYTRSFIYSLTTEAPTEGQRVLAVRLGREVGFPALSVAMSRRAAMQETHVIDAAYPAPAAYVSPTGQPERALVLAIIRQESNFNPNATSRAGARGLMQLMPRTASHLARRWSIPHSTDRLTDPVHNIRFGAGYLEETIDRFNGSYIMAIAGYNAGPGRSARWAETYGDPRRSVEEAVDWIEMIPFNETRNYVQRVMENLVVFRAVLGDGMVDHRLGQDLLR